MSFRARQTSNRARTWDARDRRSMLLNIGFGLTVLIALLLLLAAAGVSWYGDHLSSAASVNGQSISKDAYQKQLAVNAFRTDYMARRIRTLLTAGHLRTADAQGRQSVLDQRAQNAPTIALEQLIDGMVMEQLAPAQGVTVTDADVDAKVTEEATTPELRHAWMIAVAPELAAGESAPTDAEKAAAKAKADQALTDLKAGKSWDEVAKAVSTDASRDKAGDLGFIDNNAALDPSFVDALVAAAKDAPTAVVEGADGTFRIGRVSEIVDPVVDATLASQVSDAGIGMDDFRAAIRRDVLRTKLNDTILASSLAAGPQRKVAEIWMQEGSSEGGAGAIRVRHILYSPNDSPDNASKLAADDPAWAKAEAEAKATWEKLKADPSQFDAIARAESDESAAVTSGGKLPYFSTDDAIDPAFAAAIFKPGLTPGQLLDPVQSSFGWHVIQVMHGPTDVEWANTAQGGHRRRQADVRECRPRQLRSRRGRERRRHRLGRQGPARSRGRGGDLRRADRQGERPAEGRRRRQLPVPRLPGGDTDARRGPEEDARKQRVSPLVLGPEGRLQDHARPVHHRRHEPVAGVAGPAAMLDALLAEARLRWRLDPAGGFAVVVAERLVATPIEPTTPILVVPLARLRAETGPGTAAPLPGRHGHGGGDPVAVLRRLYPGDHPVGRLRRRRRDDDRGPDLGRSRGPALPRAGRPGCRRGLAVGHAVDLGSPPGARRLPVGP